MMTIKSKLITLLQNAHAGERAAAFAYRGHGRAAINPDEVRELNKIEWEEWEHRECLGKMLKELGSGPRPGREWLMVLVGKFISSLYLCGRYLNFFNFGWFMSMYGAGKLERGNIAEYEVAAQYACDSGFDQFIDPLLMMAEIEWDHELYIRRKSLESDWAKYVKIWPTPLARSTIRSEFAFRQENRPKVQLADKRQV